MNAVNMKACSYMQRTYRMQERSYMQRMCNMDVEVCRHVIFFVGIFVLVVFFVGPVIAVFAPASASSSPTPTVWWR